MMSAVCPIVEDKTALLGMRACTAAAMVCCIYGIDSNRQESKQNICTTKNEAAFRSTSNQSLKMFVNDIAQETTKGFVRRYLTNLRSNQISLAGVDLLKLHPAKALNIIQRLHEGSVLEAESLVKLHKACVDVFLNESTVVDLRHAREKITVVGDVHGSLPCLKRVLELVGNLNDDEILVVAGDYVDRGENSLEVLCTFLLLKLAYPNNVILLRGNHEDNEICSEYGFADELQQKYGSSYFELIWDSLSDVFASLPICVRTNSAIILHGGLPSADFKLSDLEAVSAEARFKLKTVTEASNSEERLLEGILWSDLLPEQVWNPTNVVTASNLALTSLRISWSDTTCDILSAAMSMLKKVFKFLIAERDVVLLQCFRLQTTLVAKAPTRRQS